MVLRSRPVASGFIEPCLPSPADRLPSGPEWVHEIKHDGYRLMGNVSASVSQMGHGVAVIFGGLC